MNAVIYARFSSDRQREASIEGQIRECTEYAKRNDITVVGSYIDRALSASKDTEKRLDFLKMISDSGKGLFDTVLVWKLDRFARDRYDSAHYKHILKKNGVKVVSATEGITSGPEGIILEAMLEGMAEYYSAELSEKIRRGQKENALKGMNNGSTAPLGYVLNGSTKKLDIEPAEAPVVLEIFKRYAEGEDLKKLRDSLNARGLTTKKGFPFTYTTLAAMLKNRKYIGEYKYGDIVIPGGIPAIVPQDIFERAQERLTKNQKTPAAAKADERYLLTTKLFCGKCGAQMVGESGKSRTGKMYHYYKCLSAKRKTGCDKKAVKKDWIEDLVVNQTMAVVMNDRLMERIADRLLAIQGAESYDLKLMGRELSEVEKGIDNLLNAIQAGIFSQSTQKRLTELESRKEQLEKAILTEKLKRPALDREEISFFLHRFRNTDVTVPEQRQRLIDCFINAVYVYDDKIVLVFNYKNGTKTVKLNELRGSDLNMACPPTKPPIFGGFLLVETVCQKTTSRPTQARAWMAENGKYNGASWRSGVLPTPIRQLFQIHRSKFEPHPAFYTGQTSVVCISHRVLLLRVREHALYCLFALCIKLFP